MPKNLSKEIKNKEYFLACVDESNEFQSAFEYACINAQKPKINLLLSYNSIKYNYTNKFSILNDRK